MGVEKREVIPLSQRPGDYIWIAIFGVFTVTSSLYAPISALNIPVRGDSPHGILRWMHGIASQTDTLIISNPKFAQFANGCDAFLFSWFQALLIYCIIKGKEWIRIPYFYYQAFHLYGTVLYTWMAYYGEWPVENIQSVIGMNAPYAVFPLIFLFARMIHEHPFTRLVIKNE